MILITGASGQIGGGVLRRLHANGHPMRAASRAPDLLSVPAGVETVRLDLTEPDAAAFDGVDQVLLYAEPAGINNLVRAAERAGVRHIVLLSSAAVLSPDADTNPLARHHILVERALTDSTIAGTILRPDAFAGNALAWSYAISAGTPVEQAYPEARVAPIHEDDIVDVAVLAISGDTLTGRTVHLTGPRPLSLREQIGTIAAHLGHDVPVKELTRAEAEHQLGQHMPAGFVTSLLDYWATAVDTPPAISDAERLTGKPARTFAQWVEEHLDAFTSAR